MGPTDAELVEWLYADPRMKALVGAGLLLVAKEEGTMDGMPSTVQLKPAPVGVENIPKKPLTKEQREYQRRANQAADSDPEPMPWWCDYSDPKKVLAKMAETGINPFWLHALRIGCHEDLVAGPTVQVAQDPGAFEFPYIAGSSVVSLALGLGGTPMITLDTATELSAARKAAYKNSLFNVLPAGSRLVLELLWRVLNDKDLTPIQFSEFEFVNAGGLLVPRSGLLSPAEALRLWLRRVGLALYAEVQLTGPNAHAQTGRIQSLTQLSQADYLCLLAPVVTLRTDAPWQDPFPVHGLVDEDPQNLQEVLAGALDIPLPPVGVKSSDWPFVFGNVPRVNAQLLFSTYPAPGQLPLIFPGGFWDVNPLSAQTAAIRALIKWKGSQDAAVVGAQSGQGDPAQAGAIRAVRAVKRWVANHFDFQGFCDVDYYEAARGDTAMPKESWGLLNSLSKWWSGVPQTALVSPGRVWAADQVTYPLMLLDEMLQAVEISLLRSCNCPARLARLAPLALETVVASASVVMTGTGNRAFTPPAYFGVLTPWLWKTLEHVALMVLPGLGRLSLGAMTRHSPIGWLRDPLAICMPVKDWWNMHPVRTIGDMGTVTLMFDKKPGQSVAGPINGDIAGMVKVQQAQGLDWQEICAPIWNQVIDDFLQTGLSRFGGALITKPLLPTNMHGLLKQWGAQKLPAGWQPDPNAQARWRQSFFEFAQTNGVVPADIAQFSGFPVVAAVKKTFFAKVVEGPIDDIAKAAMAEGLAIETKCIDSLKMLKPDMSKDEREEACRQFEVYPLGSAFWPGSVLRDSTIAGIDAFAAEVGVFFAEP